MDNQRTRYTPFLMWLFPLLFFGYQFILRLWPGLMMQPIMMQFSIDASGFGLLAACYYYGYAGMQIPIALLLARFGAQKIVFLFAVLCGLALLLFTFTSNFYLALLSRFLIGAGSAVGFLGVSQVVSTWFSTDHYAKMIGLSFSFGLLGAVYGGKPLSLLISAYQWQSIACVLALIAILIGGAAFLVLGVKPIKKQEYTAFSGSSFAALLSSKALWVLAVANLLMVGSLEGFADVWGVPYLMTAFSFSKPDAALLTSLIFVGMLFGGPLLAMIAKKAGNYVTLAVCALGLCLAFTLLLSHCISNWWLLCTLFFVVGLLCCYQVIVFATGATLVSAELLGIAIAFLNCINMFGGSLFHTLIGHLMDTFWMGVVDSQGVRVYPLHSFQYALSIIPAGACIGAVLVYWVGRRKSTLALA